MKYFKFLLPIIVLITSCQPHTKNISKNKMLKMIDSIENCKIDTININYMTYARDLLHYCTYERAFSLVDGKLSPFFTDSTMNKMWKRILYSSYLAGCIKESYEDITFVNTGYIGNMYAYNSYKKIRTIDSSLTIPFLDSLDNLIYREKIKMRNNEYIWDFLEKMKK